MILPADIKTKYKIRDAAICNAWQEGKLTNAEIARQFGVLERTMGRIVYKNRAVLKIDATYEKQKRIRWLRSQIERRSDQFSKKDLADLQEQLKIEIEGKEPLVDNSQHRHITYVWNTENSDSVQPPAVPVRNP